MRRASVQVAREIKFWVKSPMAKDHDLILLGNHGCIAVGETLEDAVKIIEAAEEVLRIYHLTKDIGPVHNISDNDLEELYENHPGSRRNRYEK